MGRRKSGEGESAAQLSRTRPFRNVRERLGVTEVRHTNPRKKKGSALTEASSRVNQGCACELALGNRVDFKSFESEA